MAENDEAVATPTGAERLWSAVSTCVSRECLTHESIDDALREWLHLTTRLRGRDSDSQDEVLLCADMLLESWLFRMNKDYIRTQIIHSLLQEDESDPLYAIAYLLLVDGCHDESTFPRMIQESSFPRLLDLVNLHRDDDDLRLHRLLLQLMYEMSRVERLKAEDLMLVEDNFIHHLFRAVEGVSDDVQDLHYFPSIRVLLVLNEQYMLASTDSATNQDATPSSLLPLTNRVVKCLSLHGPMFRMFGENIILLLNRETETSLQLLILKLLYLLFTTKATYEFFYTNDLRVLLDVIIRNLMDLPDEKMSLRHTYLRVMYPLLAHTQLSQPPHYKRYEVLRALRLLRGSDTAHFAPADETTLRLVERVAKVAWLGVELIDRGQDKELSGQAEVARKMLGMSLLPFQFESSVSVGDVAGVMERPGVQTPSRHRSIEGKDVIDAPAQKGMLAAVKTKKPLPELPKHRFGSPVKQPPLARAQVDESGKKIPPKAPPPRRFGRTRTAEQRALPFSGPEISK